MRINGIDCLIDYGAVHGVEYAYGAHEYPTTGIFEGEPKQCDGFTFRKSILIGHTSMSPGEVRAVMEDLASKYRGNAYNLITMNCNHFCNDASIRLTHNPIPSWVNRLARIGIYGCFSLSLSLSPTIYVELLIHYIPVYLFPFRFALPLHYPSSLEFYKSWSP